MSDTPAWLDDMLGGRTVNLDTLFDVGHAKIDVSVIGNEILVSTLATLPCERCGQPTSFEGSAAPWDGGWTPFNSQCGCGEGTFGPWEVLEAPYIPDLPDDDEDDDVDDDADDATERYNDAVDAARAEVQDVVTRVEGMLRDMARSTAECLVREAYEAYPYIVDDALDAVIETRNYLAAAEEDDAASERDDYNAALRGLRAVLEFDDDVAVDNESVTVLAYLADPAPLLRGSRGRRVATRLREEGVDPADWPDVFPAAVV